MQYALNSLLKAIIPIALGWFVGSQVNSWAAIAIGVIYATTTSTAGALLLWSTKVGQITWRNYLAGWLMPWGYRIVQKLASIAFVSGCVGLGLFTIGVIAERRALSTAASDIDHEAVSWPASVSLATIWLVYGAAWMYVLGQYCRTSNRSQQSTTSFLKALGVVGGTLVASIVCHIAGQTWWALSIAGVPLLVISAFYGTVVIVILLSGKNARWN